MKKLIVGIGGVTNGGKTTLSRSLQERLPNSCVISQDNFFKDNSVVPVDHNGFKQYDVLSALHMDRMMSAIEDWLRDPQTFMTSHGLPVTHPVSPRKQDKDVFILIVEGFLIFNYAPLNSLIRKRYFLDVPYEVSKERRSSRVYSPPDPPGYFDGHVWPMYLKNREEMESMVKDMVFLDGTLDKEELVSTVYEEVMAEVER
ncbi:nicotinamide riboside kinase 1 [Chanos chanos]|uniref:Nicotinamide riboside kinase 1 n=1 Tax=Chanos chanos TaxID=29144 RepID=A0A6J2VEV5_CHACN|nr:nicotinamide riboside kinase 1-like [Chanos chanos]